MLLEDLVPHGLNLSTLLHWNMKDLRFRAYVTKFMRNRRLVETVSIN